MSTYLIVADRSAWSMGLTHRISAVGEKEQGAEFVVMVPADPTFPDKETDAMLQAQEAAARARTSLTLQGMTVLDALAGPSLPRKALEQEIGRKARAYDGIFVGTSRRSPGRQIQAELVGQLQRRYGLPVQLIDLQETVTG